MVIKQEQKTIAQLTYELKVLHELIYVQEVFNTTDLRLYAKMEQELHERGYEVRSCIKVVKIL